MVCEGLEGEEPPTPEHSHWDALRLICAAEICEEMRAAVLQRTGFKCSAGIAHNKVQCDVTQVSLLDHSSRQNIKTGNFRNLYLLG